MKYLQTLQALSGRKCARFVRHSKGNGGDILDSVISLLTDCILAFLGPIATIPNWNLWKNAHSGSSVGEICEKCASRWNGLDGANAEVSHSLQSELSQLWQTAGLSVSDVGKERDLTHLATGLLAALAKHCNMKCAGEIFPTEQGSLNADFVYALSAPSTLWKVRIQQSCMEVEFKRPPVAEFGTKWHPQKPWTALVVHGNSGLASSSIVHTCSLNLRRTEVWSTMVH